VAENPKIGEANLAALIGAVIGSTGGLFAVGIVPAIVSGRPQYLIAAPTFSILCFFGCGVIAWFLAGQIGPRLARLLGERNGNVVGGLIGGLLPLAALAYWGWRLATS
jgi:hypothetical protein